MPGIQLRIPAKHYPGGAPFLTGAKSSDGKGLRDIAPEVDGEFVSYIVPDTDENRSLLRDSFSGIAGAEFKPVYKREAEEFTMPVVDQSGKVSELEAANAALASELSTLKRLHEEAQANLKAAGATIEGLQADNAKLVDENETLRRALNDPNGGGDSAPATSTKNSKAKT